MNMKLSPGNVFARVMNLLAYTAMVATNYAAVTLPLWWKSTQTLSETYPSLFVPAGYVFSIWGLIYILLGWCILFQFLDLFLKRHEKVIYDFVERKSPWFVLSCLLNIGWLFAWHSENIGLSLLAMTGLFVTLSFMYSWLATYSSGQHPKRFRLFFLVPLRIYFGWISVAIFANIASLFASMWIWQSLQSQLVLSVVLIAFVLALFVYVLLFYRDYVYALVWVWALVGILLKRLMTDPIETYPIILATIVGLVVLSYFFGFTRKLKN